MRTPTFAQLRSITPSGWLLLSISHQRTQFRSKARGVETLEFGFVVDVLPNGRRRHVGCHVDEGMRKAPLSTLKVIFDAELK